jgi:hypothetical protein
VVCCSVLLHGRLRDYRLDNSVMSIKLRLRVVGCRRLGKEGGERCTIEMNWRILAIVGRIGQVRQEIVVVSVGRRWSDGTFAPTSTPTPLATGPTALLGPASGGGDEGRISLASRLASRGHSSAGASGRASAAAVAAPSDAPAVGYSIEYVLTGGMPTFGGRPLRRRAVAGDENGFTKAP